MLYENSSGDLDLKIYNPRLSTWESVATNIVATYANGSLSPDESKKIRLEVDTLNNVFVSFVNDADNRRYIIGSQIEPLDATTITLNMKEFNRQVLVPKFQDENSSYPIATLSGDDASLFYANSDLLEFNNGPVLDDPSDNNFDNVYQVSLTLTDSDFPTRTITLNLAIQVEANSLPVAGADSYTLSEDQTLQFNLSDLLANDSDAEADPFYFDFENFSNWDSPNSFVTTPHGQVVYDGDGGFDYYPNPNFNGTDTLTYRLRDEYNRYSIATTVTFVVQAVNDAPILLTQNPITPIEQLLPNMETYQTTGALPLQDGKLIIYGWDNKNSSNGYQKTLVMTRWLSQGILDSTFGNAGLVEIVLSDEISSADHLRLQMVQQTDGKLNAVISFTQPNEVFEYDASIEIIQLNEDGTVNVNYANQGIAQHRLTNFKEIEDSPLKVLVTSSNQLILGSSAWDKSRSNDLSTFVVKLNADGTIDSTFGSSGLASVVVGSGSNYFLDFDLSASNEVFVLGSSLTEDYVYKLTASGGLDIGFNATGIFSSSDSDNYYKGLAISRNSPNPKLYLVGEYEGTNEGGSAIKVLHPTTGVTELTAGLTNGYALESLKALDSDQLIVSASRIDYAGGSAYLGRALLKFSVDFTTGVAAGINQDTAFTYETPDVTVGTHYNQPTYSQSDIAILGSGNIAQLLDYNGNTVTWNNLTPEGEPDTWDLIYDVASGSPMPVTVNLAGFDPEGETITYAVIDTASSEAEASLNGSASISYYNNNCNASGTQMDGSGNYYDLIDLTLTDSQGASSTPQTLTVKLVNCNGL